MRHYIYSADGTKLCTVSRLEMTDVYMGTMQLTVRVVSPTPVALGNGCYMDYRGERFTLNYLPSVKKQARSGKYGEAFVYEDVILNSYRDELTRCSFLDVTENTTENAYVPYTNLPSVSFTDQGLEQVRTRLQANMDRLYGTGTWSIVVAKYIVEGSEWTRDDVNGSAYDKDGNEIEDYSYSVDNIKCWEMLTTMAEAQNVNFTIKGRTVTIGERVSVASDVLYYGRGKGLKSITATSQESEDVITVLHVYGNTTNMPYRYYNQWSNGITALESMYAPNLMLPGFARVKMGDASEYEYEYYDESLNRLSSSTGASFAFVKRWQSVSDLADTMYCSDVWLESLRSIEKYGRKEGVHYFTEEGDTYEDIYPSLEWAGNHSVTKSDNISDNGIPDESGDIDPSYFTIEVLLGFSPMDSELSTGSSPKLVMTSGMCTGREFEISSVEILTEGSKYSLTCNRELDEDINRYFPYSAGSGMAAYHIQADDEFTITDIYMPDEYVEDLDARTGAAFELLSEGLRWLKAHDTNTITITPEIDDQYMARDTSDEPLRDQMRAGIALDISDDEMTVNTTLGTVTISSLTITEGDSMIPHYEVTLNNDKEADLVTRVTSEVVSRIGSGTSSSGLTNAKQIESIVKKLGGDLYLSKKTADAAAGVITFGKGLVSEGDARIVGELLVEGAAEFQKSVQHGEWTYFGEFVASLYAGMGGGVDSKGNAEFESLKVRSALEVLELIVNRLSAIEGDQLLTEADTIESIVDVGNGVYGLYLREKWDGYFTAQAQNNVLKGIINTLAEGSGEYYTSWMRVNSVDTAQNYIEVVLYDDDETPAGKNYPPCETMKIARWGNQSDTTRQGCLYLSSTEGRIVKLTGVTKPILDDANYGTTLGTIPEFVKNLTTASGGKVVTYDNRDYLYAMGVIVQDFIQIDYQGKPVCTYVDRGTWAEGEKYYCQEKNEETGVYEISDVWHYGCKWRCAKNLTTSEPVFNNTDWAMIEGDPTFHVDFVEQEQLYDADNFSAALTIVATLYNQDVTENVDAADVVWTRYTEDNEGNQRTDSDTIWNNKRGSAGKSIILTMSDLDIETYMPPVIKFTAEVTLRTSDGEEVATDSVSLSIN